MYYIDIEMDNNTSAPITTTIIKGTVLEVTDPSSHAQCLVAATDVTVRLPPGRSVVQVPGLCLNRDLSSPSMNPGRLTPFVMTSAFATQQDIWNRITKGI